MSHLLSSFTSGTSVFTKLLFFLKVCSDWCSRLACGAAIIVAKNEGKLRPQHLAQDRHRDNV